MAIAVDTTSSATAASTNSLTWSHTCTGGGLCLVVELFHANGDVVTGVTYNGVAMTQAAKAVNTGDMTSYIYYLFAPATGAHNIVASASVSNSFGGGAVSLTGVESTTPLGVTGNTTASLSKSVTTTAANSYLVESSVSNGGDLGGRGAGQTAVYDSSVATDVGGGSYKATTTIGSYTMSRGGGGGTKRGIAVAEFIPHIIINNTATITKTDYSLTYQVFSVLAHIVNRTIAFTAQTYALTMQTVHKKISKSFSQTTYALTMQAVRVRLFLNRFVNKVKHIGTWTNKPKI